MTAYLSTSRLRTSLILAFLMGAAVWWQWRSKGQASEATHPPSQLTVPISFTERRLRAAEKQLQLRPKDPEAYAEMAAAYMEKARETGDGAFYGRAEAACQKALELAPDNYAALRLVSWVQSGQHRFREALVSARRALERDAKDPLNYGTLGDALLELGEYQEGAQAIQKMVDLRPDVSSYTRAAYVRELFGDVPGAIEIMSMAVRAASSRDHEQNAWCRVQLGNLFFHAGRLADAEAQYKAALQIFPNYHFAFTGLGRVKAAQEQFDEAIRFYQASVDLVPTHEAVFGLADLYAHLGVQRKPLASLSWLKRLRRSTRPMASSLRPSWQCSMPITV